MPVWVEALAIVISVAITIGVLKKGQTALEQRVSEYHKDAKTDMQRLSEEVSQLRLISAQQVERYQAVQAAVKQLDQDMTLQHDEIKADVRRHQHDIGALKVWRAAADQEFKHLDSEWRPGEV